MERRVPVLVGRLLLALLAGCLSPLAAVGVGGSEDVPPVRNRPPHYSEAIGSFQVVLEAQPTELHVDETLLLTVRIRATGPVREGPRRPNPKNLPGFSERFYIEDLPDQDKYPAAGVPAPVWEFVYRLRPRGTDVDAVPSFPFVFYKPAPRGSGLRGTFQTAYASRIPLTVKPVSTSQPPVEGGVEPIQAPESAFHIVTGASVLRRPWSLGPLEVVAVCLGVVGVPLVCLAWFVVWQRLYPDAARRARQRRSQAARQALRALRTLRMNDPAEQARRTAAILTNYLRQRYDLLTVEPTPDEAAAHLEGAGVPPKLIQQVADFFRTCDAARFAPATVRADQSGQPTPWATSAARLIQDLEGGVPTSSITPSHLVLLSLVLGMGSFPGVWEGTLGASPSASAVEKLSDAELLQHAEAAFQKGTAARDQPEEARRAFAEAAADYEVLRRRGYGNAALLGNEGSAYLLAGDLPRAILAYRRGLRLVPNDWVMRGQLTFARSQVAYTSPGSFARPPGDAWPPWLPRPGPGVLGGLALLLYAAGWVLLTRWRMVRRGRLLLGAILVWIGATLLGGVLVVWVALDRAETRHPLVVIADDGVLLRQGNGLTYPPRYETPLNRGVEARLLFQRGDWLKIELSGGARGWVPARYALLDDRSVVRTANSWRVRTPEPPRIGCWEPAVAVPGSEPRRLPSLNP